MAGVPVRVLVADDHELSAAVTTAALGMRDGFELVGLALSVAQAREFAASTRPDVALVDVQLPGGADTAVRAILGVSPDTRVLAHSTQDDHATVTEMLLAGAGGYVLREAPAPQLVSALRSAAAGEANFNGAVGGGALHDLMGQLHAANRAHAERISTRARIRRVIDHGELEIVFQPIVDLESREIVGYEALSRIPGEPERGPDAWFAEAHDVGLGTELELFAVRIACERSHALPDGVFLAVNVSPVTAERADLLTLLAACSADHVVL